jgi:hypothetical protein
MMAVERGKACLTVCHFYKKKFDAANLTKREFLGTPLVPLLHERLELSHSGR